MNVRLFTARKLFTSLEAEGETEAKSELSLSSAIEKARIRSSKILEEYEASLGIKYDDKINDLETYYNDIKESRKIL